MPDTDSIDARRAERKRTENDTAAELALQAAQTHDAERGALLLSPTKQEVINLERYADAPRTKRGTVALHAPAALSKYVNAHHGPGTAIYADEAHLSIEAVLNGHVPVDPDTADVEATAGWGDYRAVLELRPTPEWAFWTERDGDFLSQIAFAHHIERGRMNITAPPAADMLELAQSFEANTSVEFASSHRLASGQRQLLFKETTAAHAGESGELEVPETFTISLAPFEGTEAVDITCWLRYRIGDGKLTIGYELDRPDDVLLQAFNTLLAEITAATGIDPYAGTAPAALR